MTRFILVAMVAALMSLPNKALAITYDLQPFTLTISTDDVFGSLLNGIWDVSGTVTTNGTTGVLQISDFTSASATAVRQGDNFTLTLDVDDPSSDGLTVIGTTITATPSTLTVSFGEADTIFFSGLTAGIPYTVGYREGSVFGFLDAPSVGIASSTLVSSGNDLILTSVPVPPALPLGLAGIVLLGWLGRRQVAQA
ncbi:MAG: hypothetical protein AAGH74_06205 [Pseudomonadota bacterium]